MTSWLDSQSSKFHNDLESLCYTLECLGKCCLISGLFQISLKALGVSVACTASTNGYATFAQPQDLISFQTLIHFGVTRVCIEQMACTLMRWGVYQTAYRQFHQMYSFWHEVMTCITARPNSDLCVSHHCTHLLLCGSCHGCLPFCLYAFL